MNILIISYIYPNKYDLRLGLFVHEQAKELLKQRHKVFVLTSSSDFDSKEIIDGIVVYRLGSRSLMKGMFFSFKAFFKILQLRYKIEIVHLHFVGLNSFFCWIASKIIKVPLVATIHGIDVCPKNYLHNFLIRMYLFFPKKIMAVSRYTFDLAALNCDRKKLIVVNNGVDLEKLKVTKSREVMKKELNLGNKKILLSVGGLVKRKGIDIVIKALHGVIKKVPNLAYLVIGRGSELENLKVLSKSLGLEEKVRFLGYVSNSEIANYFNLCDVFVLMSNTIKDKGGIEGFGIVYIEASAMGKPAIGGKSGGTGDAIVDNATGFRVQPNSLNELIKKLILLLRNDRLRLKMGSAGRKRVLKNFLWKHNVEKTIEVYKAALKR
ncbi:MAG: glycosyltransferase family 4 protein [Nanoarchaeota archaeon]